MVAAQSAFSVQPADGFVGAAAGGDLAARSDETLLKAIAAGHQQAMRALYQRHSTPVYRFARRLVGDDAAAEDVTSEVFLDVWRRAGTFDGRSKVSTWLLAIARHKALDAARRRAFVPLDRAMRDRTEDGADDPEIVTHKKQVGAALRQCLARLSPAHREVVDLVYYHEKSVDEVAQIICVSPNTVKSRMFYARSHLSRMLADARLAS
jgi:RNA polymerase sigma-70 factor (ECF subfamily)